MMGRLGRLEPGDVFKAQGVQGSGWLQGQGTLHGDSEVASLNTPGSRGLEVLLEVCHHQVMTK